MLILMALYQEEGIKCECAICISLNITKPFLKLKKMSQCLSQINRWLSLQFKCNSKACFKLILI